MKPNSIKQEILLMTETSFSQRELSEKDSTEDKTPLSPAEQLEEACWNGFLYEMLPGIIEKTASGKQLYLWHIRLGESFLQMELCEHPQFIEQHTSIDPYSFMPVAFLN